MARPHTISSWKESRRIVKKILVEEDKIALSVKQKYFDKPGDIYLVIVGTWGGDVYLFDLRTCADILHKGGLWRIFKSPALLKTMHDCRTVSRTLATQYGVELNNVFDTQAAYALMLMERRLPARLIELQHLYEKFGDAQQKLLPMLQYSGDMGGIFWAQRPMHKEMVYSVACEVLALMPTMYQNIKNDLSSDLLDVFEDLCRSYTTGDFSRPTKHLQKFETPSKTPRSARSLKPADKNLVQHSLPSCTGTFD